MQLTVQIKHFEDVKKFVEICEKQDIDVDVSSGRYIVDGKSIMGILGLDLSQPVNVKTLNSTEKQDTDFFRTLIEECIDIQ